jgi:S1-C subfamily serine protease
MPFAMLAGCALALAVMFLYLQINPQEGRYDEADIRELAQQQIASVTPTPPRGPEVFAAVRPSVVMISHRSGNEEVADGAGVVFDENGSILTAFHVIDGLSNIRVRFFDGSTASATVVQEARERDLAVIQVDRLPDGVLPAILGGEVHQGSEVMAIGAPLGFDGSASQGIVSAIGRRFVVEDTGQVIEGMIQFDAAANPGNSGGPLVNMNGQVIGIVTGIINPTGERVFIGLGFAVPIEAAGVVIAPIT